MTTIDIMIWIIFILVLVVSLYAYAMLPDKCPMCKTRMKHRSRPRDGKLVSSQECPKCGYEIILDEDI